MIAMMISDGFGVLLFSLFDDDSGNDEVDDGERMVLCSFDGVAGDVDVGDCTVGVSCWHW